jgi:hypothetical protein
MGVTGQGLKGVISHTLMEERHDKHDISPALQNQLIHELELRIQLFELLLSPPSWLSLWIQLFEFPTCDLMQTVGILFHEDLIQVVVI